MLWQSGHKIRLAGSSPPPPLDIDRSKFVLLSVGGRAGEEAASPTITPASAAAVVLVS